MTAKNSNVLITKANVAQRQLNAAIRLYFSEEDALAVHTVASAAYRVLRDLHLKRGKGHAEELFRAGLFKAVVDYGKGIHPPPHMLTDKFK